MNDGEIFGGTGELIAVGAETALPGRGGVVGILDDVVVDERVAIDLIAALTRMEAACAAARVKVTQLFRQSRLAKVADGLPDRASKTLVAHRLVAVNRSTAAEVALARQQPPHAGSRLVEQSRMLCEELPATLTELTEGRLTQQRAVLIAEAAARLAPEMRAEFDRRAGLVTAGKSDARVRDALRGLSGQLDPQGMLERNRKDVKERYVAVRPHSEGMGRLTIVAPLAQTVAAFASLKRHADLARNIDGDPRTKGQLQCDEAISRLTCGAVQGCDDDGVPLRWSEPTTPSPTLVDDNLFPMAPFARSDGDPVDQVRARSRRSDRRIDGRGSRRTAQMDDHHRTQSTEARRQVRDEGAAPADRPGVPVSGGPVVLAAAAAAPQVHLHLILTDRALLGLSDEPAEMLGHGTVPAFVARRLAVAGAGRPDDARTTIRRYLTDPVSGRLADCDPKVRFFPDVMKEFLMVRDRVCRTPWCSAAIREGDHIVPTADGGPTTTDNGQGLCRYCNLLKESGSAEIGRWSSRLRPDGTIVVTTPTGHRYLSPEPPPLPG